MANPLAVTSIVQTGVDVAKTGLDVAKDLLGKAKSQKPSPADAASPQSRSREEGTFGGLSNMMVKPGGLGQNLKMRLGALPKLDTSAATLARGDSPGSSAGSKSESVFSRFGSAASSAMTAMSPVVAGAEGLAGTVAGAAGAVSQHTNSTSTLGQGGRLAESVMNNNGTAGIAQLGADSGMSTAWKMAKIENDRQTNDMLINQSKEETKSIADAARPAT
ncbi:hypothetical protein BWP39_22830 [Paraburkholderia acidicola]|uniref:Uncharacterized protein n=1 Tax=Paraburkholderia acidicola TaxID=1912599 RepID=A0A2A4EQS1_9BURK|nr:hypothetical protein [Paraburkholderia acidicola]PCE22516.1 hypothetical protein BWP39_22830 [Paraburkholderia acidicola]